MSMFAKKVALAKPSDSAGLFFLPGLYPLVQIASLKLIQSKKPGREGAEMFIIDCDILDSRCPERPAGTQNVAQILNSQHVSAPDDVKRFLAALFNGEVDPDSIDEAGISALVSAEQPAAGRCLALEVYDKKSEKTGKTFTKHVWRAPAPELAAKAAELRAKLGLAPL